MESVVSAEELYQQNLQLKQENQLLKEELAHLKRLIFGRKSEKLSNLSGDQPTLFEEGPVEGIEMEEQDVAAHKRRKVKNGQPLRLSLPAHLPRIEETIEPEDKPAEAKKIGEEVSEQLAYQPANLYVRRIIRPKYVDASKEQDGVFTAPMPSLALPKSKADASLLAHILISKYVDHLPLYRQVQQYKRQGVDIPSSTMSDWFMASCRLLSPLYEVLKAKLLTCNYLQADETPIKVQLKDKKGKLHQGYHWVYHDVENRIACFDYRKSRSRAGPKDFLAGYQGLLQSDGYTAYDEFDRKEGITLLGCMAHVRRKFVEARDNDARRSDKVLAWIGELYGLEQQYREEGHDVTTIGEHRNEQHQPILDKIEAYCQEEIHKVAAKSAIGKALGYAIRQWPKVKRYKEYGHSLIDNNLVENAIRPVALGRKNYLFAGSHQAAQWAAMTYSFMATCKLQGVEPFEWMRSTLEKIPEHPVNQLEELLPVKKEDGV
ncbi:MAG: IS66 family transposase [Gammaproteobacteria bacterium]|nr:IS66 family transposase [Gammaproteobacteria bacterium]